MSEYQYIEFRAVDRSLTDSELAYANKQSSRAAISKRSFSNEYNYSSFRGNVNGLLRRGYDIFLEYTNYGNRTLKIRLPHGLPFDRRVTKPFIGKHLLSWDADGKGKAGILTMQPYLEIPDPVWEFDDYMDQAIELRKSLITGDLRALYLCWLFVAADENNGWDEAIEPPVPIGLEELETDYSDLFLFFDLDPLVLKAASGEGSAASQQGKTAIPNISKLPSIEERVAKWVKKMPAAEARKFVLQLLVEDESVVKAELLAQLPGQDRISWPTVRKDRNFRELFDATEQLIAERSAVEKKKAATKAKREAAKAQKLREQRMIEMVADPQPWLEAAASLAEKRGTQNYEQAAEILADLQEALINSKNGKQLARKHAAHLVRKHPTLSRLKGALRKRGVLD
jgi:hypothetical protein